MFAVLLKHLSRLLISPFCFNHLSIQLIPTPCTQLTSRRSTKWLCPSWTETCVTSGLIRWTSPRAWYALVMRWNPFHCHAKEIEFPFLSRKVMGRRWNSKLLSDAKDNCLRSPFLNIPFHSMSLTTMNLPTDRRLWCVPGKQNEFLFGEIWKCKKTNRLLGKLSRLLGIDLRRIFRESLSFTNRTFLSLSGRLGRTFGECLFS